jgi:hypothetical protein
MAFRYQAGPRFERRCQKIVIKTYRSRAIRSSRTASVSSAENQQRCDVKAMRYLEFLKQSLTQRPPTTFTPQRLRISSITEKVLYL